MTALSAPQEFESQSQGFEAQSQGFENQEEDCVCADITIFDESFGMCWKSMKKFLFSVVETFQGSI